MEKLNGFEKWLVEEGIKKISTAMKEEIKLAESSGKRHIMTEGYVDMVVEELLKKINNFSKKEKK